MSASWLSETFHGVRRTPGLLALLVLALGALPGTNELRAAAAVDSGSKVTRIRVSDRGIVVDGEALRDSADEWSDRQSRRERVRDRVRARVRVDGGPIVIDDGGTGIVRIWSDAHVPAGEVVDGEVVAVFGSVTVEGAVNGNVVAVMGSVRLAPGARVEGDAVSIGGTIEQGEGSTIRGESVQLGFSPFTFGLPARSVIVFAIAAGWLVSMFTGWIFVLLFPAGMLRVGTVVERRPAASFFLGVLSVPGFVVGLILLCITVIGIPLAVLLPLFYMLIGYAGQLAATAVLGARLARRSLGDGLLLPLLVGTLFVAALLGVGALMLVGGGATQPIALFLLFAGCALLLGLGALGTGACLLSRFGTRPRDVVWRGHGVPGSASSTSPGAVPGPLSPPATG
jgi:hypothetical protein